MLLAFGLGQFTEGIAGLSEANNAGLLALVNSQEDLIHIAGLAALVVDVMTKVVGDDAGFKAAEHL
jgi:hypothetical protein